MRVFLDTSVLIAASGSARGASREIFRLAPTNDWTLLASPYVVGEVFANISSLPVSASADWVRLRNNITIVDDVLTLERPAVFPASKDRPVLFTAVAWADVLVTHDRQDFGEFLGKQFYGLPIRTPGMFLTEEREHGRLRQP